MKSHTEYLTFHLPARMGFVNITSRVAEAVQQSGVAEGLVLVNAMHITASVFINDDEAGLHDDYKKWLEQLAPFDASPQTYSHNRTGEDNADAHLKRQVMGREVVVAITKGKLDLGPWEQIFYGEFDGRRPEAGTGEGHWRVSRNWNGRLHLPPLTVPSFTNPLSLHAQRNRFRHPRSARPTSSSRARPR